jgi:hypothetical protein
MYLYAFKSASDSPGRRTKPLFKNGVFQAETGDWVSTCEERQANGKAAAQSSGSGCVAMAKKSGLSPLLDRYHAKGTGL